LRLPDDVPEHHPIDDSAEHGEDRRRRDEPDPVVQAHGGDEGVRHEGAQHQQVALCEVDDFRRLVDENETEGDQAIDAADGKAVDRQLQKLIQALLPELFAAAARPPDAPTWKLSMAFV